MTTITKTCPMCGTTNAKEYDGRIAEAITRYQIGIGYIQDIPLPATDREFIKTGFCESCQAMLFADPFGEEE